MVSIKKLRETLQNQLNTNNKGLFFKLFTDTGRYKKASRSTTNYNEVEKYINGIFNVTSSNISNTNTSLEYGTITARVELLVKCNEERAQIQNVEGNEGYVITEVVEPSNETYLEHLRAYLDQTFALHDAFYIDEEANRYQISASYSMAISGQRNSIIGVGDSYTFVFFVYYNVVKMGENSKDYEIYLDGERLPYGILTLRRVPAQSSNLYSNQKSAVGKSINDSTVLGISVECPAFVSSVNNTIKNYLLKGEENIAHFLTLKLNGLEEDYLVLFGEVDATCQGVLNVGQTLTFVETIAEYGIISFPSNYNLYVNDTYGESIAFSEDKKIYNITKKEFSNVVGVGDFVATMSELNGLTKV